MSTISHSNANSHISATIQHIDYKLFNEMQELLADDFETLVRRYMQDCQLRLQQLINYIKQRRFSECHDIVHTFKGASLSLGLNYSSYLCDLLEDALASQNLLCIDKLLIDLSVETKKVHQEINKLLS